MRHTFDIYQSAYCHWALHSPLLKGNTMTTTYTEDKEKLISDLKNFITETEELLHLTADQAGERAESIRFKVTERLKKASIELDQLQSLAMKNVKMVGHATDEFVHINPWKSIGIAAGLGMVMGLLISRR